MRDYSYEEINNMSEDTAKQILRDEMLERTNKRLQEKQEQGDAQKSLDEFFGRKRESGMLNQVKGL